MLLHSPRSEGTRRQSHYDDIVLYSGWLACGSHLTSRYLSERIIRHFDYMQYIPRDPFVYAPHYET